MKKGKKLLIIFFVSLIVLGFLGILIAENSESSLPSEWRTFHKYLNNTGWDGVDFTTISGLNYTTFTLGPLGSISSPAIARGSLYIGSSDGYFYQLNASNISRQINNITLNSISFSSPAVANGYVYIGDSNVNLYQLNATNISAQIANFTPGELGVTYSSPLISNGYAYIGGSSDTFYQLNASNVSKQITNFTVPANSEADSTPTIANGYLYLGTTSGARGYFFQLNATNISAQIANFTTIMRMGNQNMHPIVWNGSVYYGTSANSTSPAAFFQLNASNVSQMIANFSILNSSFTQAPAIANGYVYVGTNLPLCTFFQLNASNVSQMIANYSTAPGICGFSASPVIAGGSVYFGSLEGYVYRLNASNVSNLIGKIYIGEGTSSLAYAKDYIYFGSINVYQLNATNLNSNMIITDTTAPTVSINFPWSYSIASTTYSKTFPIDISMNKQGSCNYSLNNGATNYTLTPIGTSPSNEWIGTSPTLSDGIYTLTAYCIDAFGNVNNNATVAVTMYTPPSGGGTPAQITETNNIDRIISGKSSTIQITNHDISVINITINASRNIINASITVSNTNTTNPGFNIGIPFGIFYRAFHINTTIRNENLNNVTMEFRVEKTWLQHQNRSYNEVTLYRIPDANNSSWQELTTSSIRNDSQYYYFSAISPGFSTFIILVANPGIIQCQPSEKRCFDKEVQSCSGNRTWVTTEQCSYLCRNAECVKSVFGFDISLVYYGILLIVSLTIILVLFFIFRNLIKKK